MAALQLNKKSLENTIEVYISYWKIPTVEGLFADWAVRCEEIENILGKTKSTDITE